METPNRRRFVCSCLAIIISVSFLLDLAAHSALSAPGASPLGVSQSLQSKQSKRLAGIGFQEIARVWLPASGVSLEAHSEEGYFLVRLNKDGYSETLISEPSPFHILKSLTLPEEGEYTITVNSGGKWSLVFEWNAPPTAIPTAEFTPDVTSGDEYEATISALQTQVAQQNSQPVAPTQVPTLTATSPPQPTSTPVPTVVQNMYPPAVQELVDEDSSTECDHIGWAMTDEPDDTEIPHYVACVNSSGLGYAAMCYHLPDNAAGMFLGPATGNYWIGCGFFIANAGTTTQFVSPLDFAIVDASGSRYAYTPAPFLLSPDATFIGENIPPDQSITIVLGFEVSDSVDWPLRIDIRPSLSGFGSGDSNAVIILDEFAKAP